MTILTEWIWGLVSTNNASTASNKNQIPSTLPSPASAKKSHQKSRRKKRSKQKKAVAFRKNYNSLLDTSTTNNSETEKKNADQPSAAESGSTPTTTATSAVGSFVENTSQLFQESWLCCQDDSDTSAHHFLPTENAYDQREEEQIDFTKETPTRSSAVPFMATASATPSQLAAAVVPLSPSMRLSRLTQRTQSLQQQKQEPPPSLAFHPASSPSSLNTPPPHQFLFQQPPPISQLAVYHPKREWPDGTLQIVWQPPIRNIYHGVDHYTATLNLTLVDSLPTVNVHAGIELHPDEGTCQTIGRISCYVVRPQMTTAIPSDCPAGLRRFLKTAMPQFLRQERLPSPFANQNPLGYGLSSASSSSPAVRSPNALQQHLWERHNWHSPIAVSSYVYLDHIDIDPDYRGAGMGFCLLEDACRRVADRFSWMLVETPVAAPLAEYLGLFGFEDPKSTELSGWMTRWNASVDNPLLEEVLPSVPFTTHQSRQQGFHL